MLRDWRLRVPRSRCRHTDISVVTLPLLSASQDGRDADRTRNTLGFNSRHQFSELLCERMRGGPPLSSVGGCGWRRSITAPPNRGNSDAAICGFRVAYSGAIKIRGSGHSSDVRTQPKGVRSVVQAPIQMLKIRDIGIFCFSFVRCGLQLGVPRHFAAALSGAGLFISFK